MPKDIAVVAYSLNEVSIRTSDAKVTCDILDDAGYDTELVQHRIEDEFEVADTPHPILVNAGLPAGSFTLDKAIWTDSIKSNNHHVARLVRTPANEPVLVAHKTYPLAHWGWYNMAPTHENSPLRDLLVHTANWVFNGP